MITADCPRCGAGMVTFDLLSSKLIVVQDDVDHFETFCVCRRCRRPSVFELEPRWSDTKLENPDYAGKVVNWAFSTVRVAPPIFPGAAKCPEYVPPEIENSFNEAARCLAVSCNDAAGTMFRKTLDRATRALISVEPESVDKADPEYIAWKVFKDLRLRLNWLFDRGLLPGTLSALASCVHQDGNDAAHADETIGPEAAVDLQDFTASILETLYTGPGRIAANVARRQKRRGEDPAPQD